MYTKGFTLIEMLFVLMLLAIFTLLSPVMTHSHGVLSYETHRIAELINLARANALLEKRIIMVDVGHASIQVDGKSYAYAHGITCSPLSFHFNQRGNISMGNTITCYSSNQEMDIVMHLGSGHLEVR